MEQTEVKSEATTSDLSPHDLADSLSCLGVTESGTDSLADDATDLLPGAHGSVAHGLSRHICLGRRGIKCICHNKNI